MCAHHAYAPTCVLINVFFYFAYICMWHAYRIIRPKGAAVLCIIRIMYCIIRIIVLCIMQPCSERLNGTRGEATDGEGVASSSEESSPSAAMHWLIQCRLGTDTISDFEEDGEV